ncbi:MAG: hypothetical protein ABIP65_11330 [Vicinamibacterales bacterium]
MADSWQLITVALEQRQAQNALVKDINMRKVVLFLAALLLLSAPAQQLVSQTRDWALNATVIEACTCPMFCQCYFASKPARHHQHRGAARNDGFVLMPNEVQAYRVGAKAYESKGTSGFMLTLDMNSKDVGSKGMQ